MSLNLEFFNRETNITAKVVADSISESGQRITTLEIEYPRFILAELNTHRALSKNSSSSRAIPTHKMLEQIESNMAVPVYWGKQKAGMQATEEVPLGHWVKKKWKIAFDNASKSTESLRDFSVHKQTCNRLVEPFQMMRTVITGTDWGNFFNLRLHKDAQPEICMLAYKIYKAMEGSKPVVLYGGEWHLPYVSMERSYTDEDDDYTGSMTYYTGSLHDGNISQPLSLENAIKISASSCAAVSYRAEDISLDRAEKIFDMLIKAEVIHASPFEHLATPIEEVYSTQDYCDRVSLDYSKNVSNVPTTWDEGVTQQRKDGKLCSGNLTGWISYRHQLPNNTCWEFDFKERMKTFDN